MRGNIYIDFTNGALGSAVAKFHGGGSFTRWITQEIVQSKKKDISVKILLSSSLESFTPEEDDLLNHELVECIFLDEITTFEYEEDSILILPLIPSYRLSVLKKIKSFNRKLKIHLVIHGIRNIDLSKYDKYDRYYSRRQYPFKAVFLYLYKWFKSCIEYVAIKKYLSFADKVFTVSNNTLQSIVNITDIESIRCFHQQSSMIAPTESIPMEESFVLFVNSSRTGKNFFRSLDAFLEYKKKNNDDLYFYALGANDDFKALVKNVKGFDTNLINKWVRFYDYVSSDELISFYSSCQFLLYTSKSEGYGIPLLEVTKAGRPALASYATSIPEVLGTGAEYVNPMDRNSIERGIDYMYNKGGIHTLLSCNELFVKMINDRQHIDKLLIVDSLIK